ncbi:MAG: DUF1659 domain-containing protein [Romboutsia sp.]|nr:DUF1659 domain-containing protein [Romboutsia sp.]
MAIVTKNPTSLKLRFDCGIDDTTGKNKTKSKTYSNLKPDAASDDIYEVGDAIASLQKHDLLEIARIDKSTLSE